MVQVMKLPLVVLVALVVVSVVGKVVPVGFFW